VETAAHGEPADDRAEMAATVRQVAFPRPHRRVKPDRWEVQIVGRTAGVHETRHHAVPNQSLRSPNQSVRSLDAPRKAWAHDLVLIPPPGAPTMGQWDDRAIMQPNLAPLGRNRRNPEAIAPFVLNPVRGRRSQEKFVRRKLNPNPLIGLNGMRTDNSRRPHPRAD